MKSNESCGSGSGAHPIDRLEQEHSLILRVLDAAQEECFLLKGGAVRHAAFWDNYLEFLANYTDRCHHKKEEDVLFTALEALGMPTDSGPTNCMRHEHAELRSAHARLAEALTSDDTEMICHLIQVGIDALRAHIEKENEVLFPMVRQLLDDKAFAAIGQGFEEVEKQLGEGTHCRFKVLAESLCNDLPEAMHS